MMRRARPRSRCSPSIRFRTSPWTETSSPAVGSSAMSSAGVSASARATPTRRACPPESSCGIALGEGRGQADRAEQALGGRVAAVRHRQRRGSTSGSVSRRPDAQPRAQRGHGVLEHHRRAPPHGARSPGVRRSASPSKRIVAARWSPHEAQDGPGERRLARARTRRRGPASRRGRPRASRRRGC